MLLVYLCKIFQRNGALTLTGTLLDAFSTNLRRALDIDDSFKVDNVVHLNKLIVESQIDFVFSLIQNIAVSHDTSEDESIGEKRTL